MKPAPPNGESDSSRAIRQEGASSRIRSPKAREEAELLWWRSKWHQSDAGCVAPVWSLAKLEHCPESVHAERTPDAARLCVARPGPFPETSPPQSEQRAELHVAPRQSVSTTRNPQWLRSAAPWPP